MLVLTVEVWPGGNFLRRKIIAQGRISNMTNLADCSDYTFTMREEPSKLACGIEFQGEVRGHNRDNPALLLVHKALENMFSSLHREARPGVHDSRRLPPGSHGFDVVHNGLSRYDGTKTPRR